MATARVFRSGDGQAIQLPREIRPSVEELLIFRRGDEIVLREQPQSMARAFELLANLPCELARPEIPDEDDSGNS